MWFLPNLTPSSSRPSAGAKAILESLSESVGKTVVLIQTVASSVVEVHEATQASARTKFGRFKPNESVAWSKADKGTGIDAAATYSDQFVKTSAGWRFARRTFYLRYQNDDALPGRCFRRRRPARPEQRPD
jgi:hypothetical protein